MLRSAVRIVRTSLEDESDQVGFSCCDPFDRQDEEEEECGQDREAFGSPGLSRFQVSIAAAAMEWRDSS